MGEFQHSIDSKGRLIIPAKFRDQLGSKFVITRGLDGCLFGYPMDEWRVLEEKLKKLSFYYNVSVFLQEHAIRPLDIRKDIHLIHG